MSAPMADAPRSLMPDEQPTCPKCGQDVFEGDGAKATWTERNTFKAWPGHRAVARSTLDLKGHGLTVYRHSGEDVENLLVSMAKCVGDEIIAALTSYFRPSKQRELSERMIRALREPGNGKPGKI